MSSYTIQSVDQRSKLWSFFDLKDTTMLLLSWPLWAGKTSCVRARIELLWYDWSIVNSPTYTYMNSYYNSILHIDMRRIESIDHFHELWIVEQIDNHDFVCIERPKWQDLYVHDKAISLQIEKISTWWRICTLID